MTSFTNRFSRTQYYKRKLEREHYAFATRLGAQPTIAGWSHNPWQPESAPDARATRIAQEFLQYFTDEIEAFGYLPYFGTGVNFRSTGTETNPEATVVGKVHQLYSALQTRTKENILSFRRKENAREGRQSNMDDETTPFVDAKLHCNDTLHGRVHVDQGEMEISAPAQSPIANSIRTNTVKRIAYEATRQYERHFLGTPEGAANPDTPIPASSSASILAHMMGPVDIHYATAERPTGEHVSASLIRKDSQFVSGYAHAKNIQEPHGKGRQRFAQANLMQDEGWGRTLKTAFEYYLPGDELLAYGHPHKFTALDRSRYRNGITPGETSKHYIRWQGMFSASSEDGQYWKSDTPSTCRLETRSFNDASSNITLSSLAMLAVIYGVVKSLHDNPDIADRLEQPGIHPLTTEDQAYALKALQNRCAPDYHVSQNIAEARHRFVNKSLTLCMMHEFVRDKHFPPETENKLLKKIDAFQEAVLAREPRITHGRG